MGYDFNQSCSFFLSITALGLLLSIVFWNIYFNIRKRFPVTVNCWFCNTWCKVLYDNRNSFDCPNCFQYNGFTKDGSYNKIIEAQHNVTLKTFDTQVPESSNGFCKSCNHNQQLKIIQLANFTPLNEANYDVEIEHFKKQLEKSYQLCQQCSKILKSTLLKQKATLFGLRAYNIQKKGLNVYLNKSNIVIFSKPISVRVIKKIQGSVAFLLMLHTFVQIVISWDASVSLPSLMKTYYELFQDLYLLTSHITIDLFQYSVGSFLVYVELFKIKYFSSVGLTFQLILFLIESSLMSIRINQFLCWSFLTMTSWTTNQETFIYSDLLQIFCATLIFYHSFYEIDSHTPNKTFHKLKNVSNITDEYSDEELDVSSHSANTCHSFTSLGGSKSLFNASLNKEASSPLYYKTEQNICTANSSFDTSFNTARHLQNASLFSNIQSSLEDLHLSNSTFRIGKSTSSPPSSLSPFSDHSKFLSPSKLKTVNQNSWVAGGFWRNEDGSIVQVHENVPLSRSSSQSSGFSSQINENLYYSTNPFNPFPTSTKSSMCHDLDTASPISEPAYHVQHCNYQPSWTSIADLRVSSPAYNSDFRNTHTSSNQKFDKFVLPGYQLKKQIPGYSTNKQLGLFKLPKLSTGNSETQFSNIENREFVTHPSNSNRCTMNK
ncbi:hypothetical protein WA026_015996 [Henosepilachna vigintioctopunctata]|uniref:Ima1 N-terminal domain-containing protein n=1 Tax=Henosepilachna vigintioctopunctata TaxID=420089 RepID=A0AAW1U261_9CUCU